MRKICLITLVGAGLALGSCAPKEEEEDKKNSVNLEGTWTQACQADSHEREIAYTQWKLIFSGGNLNVRMSMHEAAGCSDEYLTINYLGAYETGGDADHETDVDGATPIDIAISSITMTPATAAAATFAQTYKCTSLTFTAGEATDISTCTDMTSNGPAVDSTWHQIFKADEDTLYFGDNGGTNNGSTEALTPTELESKPFNRS